MNKQQKDGYSVAGVAVKDGNLFLAKRNKGGSLSEKWEFPGGKLEKNETFEHALKREFKEEFGVNIIVHSKLCSSRFTHKDRNYELSAYHITILGDTFSLREHTQIHWIPFRELSHIDLAESDRSLLPELGKKLPDG